MGFSLAKPMTTGILAGVSPLSAIGSAVSIASGVSGLMGGQSQPDLPQAPQVSPMETTEAESVVEDEAAKLRSLKRRQATTQKLFRLDSDNDSQTTLLGG